MNIKNIFLAAAVVLFYNNAFAQGFEGIIKMSIYNAEKNDKSEIVWKMKGNKSRLEYVGASGDKNYNYVLLLSTTEPKAKILTETNGQKMVYTVGIPSGGTDNVRYVEHTYTSNNKLIESYHAEQVTIKAADRRTTCWVSKDVPLTIDMMPAALKQNGVLNYFFAHKINSFPMEIETLNAEGKVIFSQKVTSVKAANISENEFVVGADYVDPAKVLKMEATPQQ
jgi:hypothetical protein